MAIRIVPFVTQSGEAMIVGQNVSTTGTLTITAISGSPVFLGANSLDISVAASSFPQLISLYSTVTAHSAKWDFNVDDVTNIAELSGTWNSAATDVYTFSALWDSVYSTVSDNSAGWDDASAAGWTDHGGKIALTDSNDKVIIGSTTQNTGKLAIASNVPLSFNNSSNQNRVAFHVGGENTSAHMRIDLLDPSGSGWNSALLLTSDGNLSAAGVIYGKVGSEGDSTQWGSTYSHVHANSAVWMSVASDVNANSAKWDFNVADITNLAELSGVWTSTNTDVNANSANWTWVASNSASAGELNSTTTTLNANSAIWTYVAENSASAGELNSTATTVRGYSAAWTAGRWGQNGSNDYYVYNLSSKVGIGVTNPTERLHVNGHILNTGTIFTSGGNSPQWDSAYTDITDNKAVWLSVASDVNANSAFWSSTNTDVNAHSAAWMSVTSDVNVNSATWDSVVTDVNATSGLWDSTYATVHGLSGTWKSTYEDVILQIDEWNSTWSTLTATSGDWQSAYETIITQQDEWDNTWTSLTATSSNWNTAYTDSQLNKDDLTNIANISAVWNSTNTDVNANSATWAWVASNSANILEDLTVQGSITGPTDDNLDINSDKNISLYLDKDDDGSFHKFQVYNEDGDIKFAVASDGKAAIGGAVTSNSIDGLTVIGDISATGALKGENAYIEDTIYSKSDEDTKIVFSSDQIDFWAGNERLLKLDEAADDEVVIGDGGDVNFRAATKGYGYNLYVKSENDGGVDNSVGIRNSSPQAVFHVKGDTLVTSAYGVSGNITAENYLSAGGVIYALGGSSTLWNSAWTDVNANSAKWDLNAADITLIATTSAVWDSTNVAVNTTSGAWDSVVTDVNINSGIWDSTWSTLSDNSANWESTYDQVQDSTTDLDVDSGTLFVDKSESRVGIGTTSPDTLLHLYSSAASKPILTIENEQGGSNPVAFRMLRNTSTPANDDFIGQIEFRSMNDANPSENTLYAYIAGSSPDVTDGSEDGQMSFYTMSNGTMPASMTIRSGKIGIGTMSPTKELTVVGELSAQSTIYGGSTNSIQWGSTYTRVTSAHPAWDKTHTTFSTNSTVWVSVASDVNANSAKWDFNVADITNLAELSAVWNSTNTDVNANSATWDSVVTDVNANSATWDSVVTDVNDLSAVWNSTNTDVNATSATWDSVVTDVNVNSATWDSVVTDVNATSATWDSVVTDVNANSATWDSVVTDVNGNSAVWDSTNTVVTTHSGAWNRRSDASDASVRFTYKIPPTASDFGTPATSGLHVKVSTSYSLTGLFDQGGSISTWLYILCAGQNNAGRILDKSNEETCGWSLRCVDDTLSAVKVQFAQLFGQVVGPTRWTTDAIVPLREWVHVGVTYDNSVTTNDPIVYINGLSAITTGSGPTPTSGLVSCSAADLFIGNSYGTDLSGNPKLSGAFEGNINEVRLFNRELSAYEMFNQFSDEPLLHSDSHTNIEILSGYPSTGSSGEFIAPATLVVGKRYRIENYIGGDDFTNVGGENATGSDFIALGTHPRSWVGNSAVRKLGCVGEWLNTSIGAPIWLDTSGSTNHGIIVDAQPVNRFDVLGGYLGINTTDVSETLTVGGTISAQGGLSARGLKVMGHYDSMIDSEAHLHLAADYTNINAASDVIFSCDGFEQARLYSVHSTHPLALSLALSGSLSASGGLSGHNLHLYSDPVSGGGEAYVGGSLSAAGGLSGRDVASYGKILSSIDGGSTFVDISNYFYNSDYAKQDTGWTRVADVPTGWIRTTHYYDRVGIGTGDPTATLTVSGNDDYAESNGIQIIDGGLSAQGPTHITGHRSHGGGGHVNIRVDGFNLQTLSLSADVTSMSTSGRDLGRTVTVRVANKSTATVMYMNPFWKFIGEKPTTIGANKTALLSLMCFGSGESDVVAAYGVQD